MKTTEEDLSQLSLIGAALNLSTKIVLYCEDCFRVPVLPSQNPSLNR